MGTVDISTLSDDHKGTYLNWNLKGFEKALDACVSIHDIGLRRGYGAFDFLRTYNKVPFMLKSHIDKFFASLEILKLNLPEQVTKEHIYEVIKILIDYAPEAELTLTLFATAGKSSNVFKPSSTAEIQIFSQPLAKSSEVKTIHEPIDTITSYHERILPKCKSLNYFPAIAAMLEKKWCDEVLYINTKGELTEASRANLFAVKDGALITPSENVLYGATREVVLKVSPFPIVMRPISLNEVYTVDEIFVTSTLKEICPVGSIDGKSIGDGNAGPCTQKLQELFRNCVQAECSAENFQKLSS